MTLWLIRAGSRGEHEQKFLDEGKVYVAWDGLNVDLKALADRQALIQAMAQRYPDEKPKALINWSSQVWSFGCEMAEGDWVVMPSKIQSGLYFGELKGNYHYEASGPDPYFHWREINWFSGLVPRSALPQDLLYSFGAFLTICKVRRNDAEARVRAMAARQWKPESISAVLPRAAAVGHTPDLSDETEASNVDLEELAADRIVRLIEARFKGHGLAELVEAITRWQRMAGGWGELHTGHCLLAGQGVAPYERLATITTRVQFAPLNNAEIAAYVATGEPLQCAGGFALEGRGGALVERIEGCFSNVIGLSLPLIGLWMGRLTSQ